MAKSRITKCENRRFRYDYDKRVVEVVEKATDEMRKDNEEWRAKYGGDLWQIGEDGYVILDTIGLRPENWDNKEARMGYLEAWALVMDETIACELDAIKRYEMA